MATVPKFTPPSEATISNLRAGMEFLQAFNELMPRAPMSYGLAFLEVASDPGHGASHYGKRLDFLQPVISRILLEIGQKSRDGGPGAGLVDSIVDPVDLRHKRYHLTPEGKALLKKIDTALSRRRKGD